MTRKIGPTTNILAIFAGGNNTISKLKNTMTRKIFALFVALFSITCISAHKFVLATYNIRLKSEVDVNRGDGWKQRCPYLTNLIRFHGFEIFGTQEGFLDQLEDIKANLPGYEYIGVGRDDGKKKGEHSAIFYDTNKFELLESGNFWLSPTPDRPGLGWDAACVRICTWGVFKIKGTKFKFVYYNLHMDHIGVVARAESAKMILNKIKEDKHELPAILSGDFNINQDNDGFKLIDNSGILNDSYRVAKFRYINMSTFNDFHPEGLGLNERIDHIFVTKHFTVEKYGELTDVYRTESIDANGKKTARAHTPSDHYPIMVVLETGKKK